MSARAVDESHSQALSEHKAALPEPLEDVSHEASAAMSLDDIRKQSGPALEQLCRRIDENLTRGDLESAGALCAPARKVLSTNARQARTAWSRSGPTCAAKRRLSCFKNNAEQVAIRTGSCSRFHVVIGPIPLILQESLNHSSRAFSRTPGSMSLTVYA